MDNNKDKEYRFHNAFTPQCVGYWILPGSNTKYFTRYAMVEKPFILHRIMMRLLLGWKWVDGNA